MVTARGRHCSDCVSKCDYQMLLSLAALQQGEDKPSPLPWKVFPSMTESGLAGSFVHGRGDGLSSPWPSPRHTRPAATTKLNCTLNSSLQVQILPNVPM